MNTLDELERLLKAGTPGPWKIDGDKASPDIFGPEGWAVALGECSQNCGYIHWNNLADADLIVAAINALPGLIESARRVEEMRAALKTIDRFSLIIEVGLRNTEPQFQPEIVAGLLKARAALKGT
jgi:hypothetical protein